MTHPRHRRRLLGVFMFPAAVCWAGNAADSPSSIPADAAVAQVAGKPIPYSELEAATHLKLEQLQSQYDNQYQQLYLGAARARAEYSENELRNLVNKRVLKLEAEARKTNDVALLAAVKTAEISDADVHSFYDSQKSQIGQPFEAVSAQIKQFLQRQAVEEAQFDYLSKLRTKYRAAISWEPVREVVEPTGPQRGSDTAAVTIIEFSDFQCPFCGRLAPTLKQVLKDYPAQVRLIFRNMPLKNIHPDAEKAAEAGVCAGLQGKFWELHDVMYAEQNSLSVDALKEKARRLNLDSKTFDDCLDSGAALTALKTDDAASARLGLSATPSSFVNGRFVNGAMPLYRWKAMIDDEIRRRSVH